MKHTYTDSDLCHMRVIVMGLGRFGGGVGVTRFLDRRGARVLVTDCAGADELGESLAELADVNVEFRLGEHADSDLQGADLLVVSPAVDRRTSAFFGEAMRRGVPWTTEMNLFLSRCPGRIVGVTGSVGKSTTCAMLEAILAAPAAAADGGFRCVFFGGNIGRSLLENLEEMTAADVVVVELSSFQLEATPAIEFRPHLAALANIRPHHLARHGDYESYLEAKLNLFRYQGSDDVAVVGTVDEAVAARLEKITARCQSKCVAAVRDAQRYDLQVPGAHNQDNAHLAVVLAGEIGVSEEVSRETLRYFPGLAHRIEFVAAIAGVRYYDDSKATSAEAVATALCAFDQPVVLLCGGKDTGAELQSFADISWHNVRGVICFGEAGEKLRELVRACPASGGKGGGGVECVGTLLEATDRGRAVAREGDVVLLSPGCPSYDAFANYEQRGRAFAALVRGWR